MRGGEKEREKVGWGRETKRDQKNLGKCKTEKLNTSRRDENDQKNKKGCKVGYIKVEYDRELEKGLIKSRNLQRTPHCELERTISKEKKLRKRTEQPVIPEGGRCH